MNSQNNLIRSSPNSMQWKPTHHYLRHISRPDLDNTKSCSQCFLNIVVEQKLLCAWEVIENIIISVRIEKRASGCFLDIHDTKGHRQIISKLQVCLREQGQGVLDTQAHPSSSPQRGSTNWARPPWGNWETAQFGIAQSPSNTFWSSRALYTHCVLQPNSFRIMWS